jgi:hypothetical protein
MQWLTSSAIYPNFNQFYVAGLTAQCIDRAVGESEVPEQETQYPIIAASVIAALVFLTHQTTGCSSR